MSLLNEPKGEHVGPEVLAALIDGRLEDPDRARAESHLADCEVCYDLFAETAHLTTEFTARGSAAPIEVQAKGPVRLPGWVWFGAAAAAVLVVVWLRPFDLAFTPAERADRELRLLAAAMTAERPTAGRLADPFAWAPPRSVSRSAIRVTNVPVDAQVRIAAIRKLAADNPQAATLNALGIAELADGRIDEAIAAFERALTAGTGDAEAEIRANLSAAFLDRWLAGQRPIDASRASDQAQRSLQLRPDYPPALFNSAYALEALGLRDAAVTAWEAVSSAALNTEWAREADEHAARLRGRTGDGSAAPSSPSGTAVAWYSDRILLEQLRAWSAYGTHPAGGGHAPNLSDAERTEWRGDRFLTDLARAASASMRWPPHRQQCLVKLIRLLMMSTSAFDASNYRSAATHARAARDEAACAGVSGVALEGQAGWADAFGVGRPVALAVMRPLVPEATALGYWRTAARAAYIEGAEAFARSRISDALVAFARAETLAADAGDLDLAATIANQQAEVYRRVRDFEAAWRKHALALGHLGDLTPRRRHIALTGAVLTAVAFEAPGLASHMSELAVANAEASGAPNLIASSYRHRARALHMLGRRDEAIVSLDAADRAQQQIESVLERRRTEAELALVRGTILRSSRPTEAVEQFTKAHDIWTETNLSSRLPEVLLERARAHLAAGHRDRAAADLGTGMRIFEDQRPGIRDQQLAITRVSGLWQLFAEAIELNRDDPIASLAIAERSRARALLASVARDRSPMPLSPPALFRDLPEDVTALVYATLPQRLLIWRVTSMNVELYDRPITIEQLDSLVEAFTDSLQQGRIDSAAKRQLSDLALPAGLELSPGATVAILPDGPLHRVPFGWLSLRDSDRPLVLDVRPVVVPNLTLLVQSADAASDAMRAALVIGFGDAQPETALPALPEVPREVNAIVAQYVNSRSLLGPAATRDAILSALPHASVVHFAGHAVADEIDPSESALFIAPGEGGSKLRAEDLAGVRLQPGAVVVLSACSTARGRIYRGEGAVTLATPFLAAGASTVVASLWPVADRVARPFLERVHERANRGATFAEAVAATQREWYERKESISQIAAWVVIQG